MPPFRPRRRPSSAGLWRVRLRRWVRSALAVAVLVGAMWFLWGTPPATTELRPEGGVRASDGDSFVMRSAAGEERLRLRGIDAPELRQLCQRASGAAWPCGAEAFAALAGRLAEPGLVCNVGGEDRFGRGLARCRTARTPDVGAAMVAAGLAVTNGRGEFPDYWLEQERAEVARRGLWQGAFEQPADWRRVNGR